MTGLSLLALPDPAAPAKTNAVSSTARTGLGRSETSQILAMEEGTAAHLKTATTAPASTPPSVADAPPMTAHEVFGFAPYWTLRDEATYDLRGFDTIAYFSLGVNASGTLSESGSGWDGYESQAFADLVTRAHALGERVVLTVSNFTQETLNALTSSPSAAATLASQVVSAIAAKHLDGVNLDLEGEGGADQAGLTSLVGTVARAVHSLNADDQVTIDTYGSSAGAPTGFFDIRALAKVVDGFFVMNYDLNLDAAATPASPLTSDLFPDTLAASQYAAAVPPSMVILGESYFGYDWPTTNGTQAATATGTPTPISVAQMLSDGDPIYWDAVTDTAWTSYEVGTQWHEAYFEDPESLYLVAQVAARDGLGMGAWALGMDGNDPAMAAALEGRTPGTGTGPPGPAATSASSATSHSSSAGHSSSAATSTPARVATSPKRTAEHTGATVPTGAGTAPTSTTSTTDGATTGGDSATGSSASGSSSAGSAGAGSSPAPTATSTWISTWTSAGGTGTGGGGTGGGGTSGTDRESGVFDGEGVGLARLALTALPAGTPVAVGTLTDFSTTDPALACLEITATPLEVWRYQGLSTDVVLAETPGNCTDAEFTFPPPAAGASPAGTSTTDQPATQFTRAPSSAPTSSGSSVPPGSSASSATVSDRPTAGTSS